MKDSVVINEVGPRDGLQNQARTLSPAERVQLIEALLAAGLRHVEVGSFVSPRAVPQMAGTDEVLSRLCRPPDTTFSVLVPNRRGYELARAAGARDIALVLAASDTMSLKNIGMDMQQVFEQSRAIIAECRADGLRTQAYISVSFECPFEGVVAPRVVEQLCGRLFEAGADEVVIADTIGAANPVQVKALLQSLVGAHTAARLSVHFHDTRAMALANCFAALDAGIRRFDSSIGGLGGCPFAPGASGNVATEDVVLMLEQGGFDTGVDLPKLMAAARLAAELTGNCPGPRSRMWLDKRYGASVDTTTSQAPGA
jgi:hydroxymethylglutaryl-CoA lyase